MSGGRFPTLLFQVIIPLLLALHRGSSQTIEFSNDRDFVTVADRLVRDIDGVPLTGTQFMAQLYYGAQNSPEGSLTPVIHPPTTFRPTGAAGAGLWIGGMRTLTGFTFGQPVALQVRVWDSTAGPTWEEAASIGFGGRQHGASAVFTYRIPNMGPVEAWWIEDFRGFTLVPEPSSVALVIGGMTGLLIFKRRKPSARRSSYPSWPKD